MTAFLAGIVKLWFAGLDLVGRFFSGVAAWARSPDRNWWAVGCCICGAGFLFAASIAQDARREIVVVTQGCDLRVATETQKLERSDGALTACLANAAIERAKQEDVNRQAAAAVEAVREAAVQDRAEFAQWMKTYRAKPATCTAALEAMEAACAGLSDY
jgi:hypothetical protein